MKNKVWIFAFVLLLSGPGSVLASLIVNNPLPISEIVTVQPIVLSDDDGSNLANFFGTPDQQNSIESYVDTIWAQAGIDVEFLAPSYWHDTFANWGENGPPDNGGETRPTSDLSAIVNGGQGQGVTNPNPLVINMFFGQIPAGYAKLGPNQAAGLAFIDANGVSQYVGSNLLTWPEGREVIASVVAHEIGHNLGLDHINEIENLMNYNDDGARLNNSQINTALASPYSVPAPVPLPAAVWLFVSGMVGMKLTLRK